MCIFAIAFLSSIPYTYKGIRKRLVPYNLSRQASVAYIHNMEKNTKDFSLFGMRELAMAGELLVAYANEAPAHSWVGEDKLEDSVSVEFNPNSGNVFLVDEDSNVAMLNGDNRLEMFYTCSECGEEGFISDYGEPLDENLIATIPTSGTCLTCTAKLSGGSKQLKLPL